MTICCRISLGSPLYSNLTKSSIGPAWNGGIHARTLFGFGKKKKGTEEVETSVRPPDPDLGFLDERVERTEEDIMKLRNKSGLPDNLRNEMRGENMIPFTQVWQYGKEHARQQYAIYGKASGLKPGIAWPRRDELAYIKGYEKVFYPPLEELVAKDKAKVAAEEDDKRKREELILANLAKLPQWKQEFFEKYIERRKVQDEELATKQKLLDEVREYLGYSVALNDPRFQEALLRKEEEKVSSGQKISKKKLANQKILEELAALAAEEMRKVQKPEETPTSEQPKDPKDQPKDSTNKSDS